MKFAASSELPVPFHFATCGYGHSGRVRTVAPCATCDAIIFSGAVPFSTQGYSAASASKRFGLVPPAQ